MEKADYHKDVSSGLDGAEKAPAHPPRPGCWRRFKTFAFRKKMLVRQLMSMLQGCHVARVSPAPSLGLTCFRSASVLTLWQCGRCSGHLGALSWVSHLELGCTRCIRQRSQSRSLVSSCCV